MSEGIANILKSYMSFCSNERTKTCFTPLNFDVFFYELGKNTLAFVNNVLLKSFFPPFFPLNEDLSVSFFPGSQLVMQLKIVLNL